MGKCWSFGEKKVQKLKYVLKDKFQILTTALTIPPEWKAQLSSSCIQRNFQSKSSPVPNSTDQNNKQLNLHQSLASCTTGHPQQCSSKGSSQNPWPSGRKQTRCCGSPCLCLWFPNAYVPPRLCASATNSSNVPLGTKTSLALPCSSSNTTPMSLQLLEHFPSLRSAPYLIQENQTRCLQDTCTSAKMLWGHGNCSEREFSAREAQANHFGLLFRESGETSSCCTTN